MPYVSYIEFNVPATAPAAAFYKQAFGWDPQGWGDDENYLISSHGDEPGIDTALQTAPDGKPPAIPIITVPDLDTSIASVKKAGGTITVERFAIEGMGYAAYFTDPSGLTLGIYQNDANAK